MGRSCIHKTFLDSFCLFSLDFHIIISYPVNVLMFGICPVFHVVFSSPLFLTRYSISACRLLYGQIWTGSSALVPLVTVQSFSLLLWLMRLIERCPVDQCARTSWPLSTGLFSHVHKNYFSHIYTHRILEVHQTGAWSPESFLCQKCKLLSKDSYYAG